MAESHTVEVGQYYQEQRRAVQPHKTAEAPLLFTKLNSRPRGAAYFWVEAVECRVRELKVTIGYSALSFTIFSRLRRKMRHCRGCHHAEMGLR